MSEYFFTANHASHIVLVSPLHKTRCFQRAASSKLLISNYFFYPASIVWYCLLLAYERESVICYWKRIGVSLWLAINDLLPPNSSASHDDIVKKVFPSRNVHQIDSTCVSSLWHSRNIWRKNLSVNMCASKGFVYANNCLGDKTIIRDTLRRHGQGSLPFFPLISHEDVCAALPRNNFEFFVSFLWPM